MNPRPGQIPHRHQPRAVQSTPQPQCPTCLKVVAVPPTVTVASSNVRLPGAGLVSPQVCRWTRSSNVWNCIHPDPVSTKSGVHAHSNTSLTQRTCVAPTASAFLLKPGDVTVKSPVVGRRHSTRANWSQCMEARIRRCICMAGVNDGRPGRSTRLCCPSSRTGCQSCPRQRRRARLGCCTRTSRAVVGRGKGGRHGCVSGHGNQCAAISQLTCDRHAQPHKSQQVALPCAAQLRLQHLLTCAAYSS